MTRPPIDAREEIAAPHRGDYSRDLELERSDAPMSPPKALRNAVAFIPADQGDTRAAWQITPSLLAWLSDPGVAKWACNTASAMVRTILDALPTNDRVGKSIGSEAPTGARLRQEYSAVPLNPSST
jgi:hypothetical protein